MPARNGRAAPACQIAAAAPQTGGTLHPTGTPRMIRIGHTIVIADEEIGETFIRASGPGG